MKTDRRHNPLTYRHVMIFMMTSIVSKIQCIEHVANYYVRDLMQAAEGTNVSSGDRRAEMITRTKVLVFSLDSLTKSEMGCGGVNDEDGDGPQEHNLPMIPRKRHRQCLQQQKITKE